MTRGINMIQRLRISPIKHYFPSPFFFSFSLVASPQTHICHTSSLPLFLFSLPSATATTTATSSPSLEHGTRRRWPICQLYPSKAKRTKNKSLTHQKHRKSKAKRTGNISFTHKFKSLEKRKRKKNLEVQQTTRKRKRVFKFLSQRGKKSSGNFSQELKRKGWDFFERIPLWVTVKARTIYNFFLSSSRIRLKKKGKFEKENYLERNWIPFPQWTAWFRSLICFVILDWIKSCRDSGLMMLQLQREKGQRKGLWLLGLEREKLCLLWLNF